MSYRLPQWAKWHNKGVDLNVIRTTSNQIKQAETIISLTSLSKLDNASIIEIGPADGGVCNELMKKFNSIISKYVLVDDTTLLDKCKNTLNQYQQIEYVKIDDVTTVNDTHFNLFISSHCLEETPKSYQELIYDKFFAISDEIFVLCNIVPKKTWNQFDPKELENAIKRRHEVSITPGHQLSTHEQRIFYGKLSN